MDVCGAAAYDEKGTGRSKGMIPKEAADSCEKLWEICRKRRNGLFKKDPF